MGPLFNATLTCTITEREFVPRSLIYTSNNVILSSKERFITSEGCRMVHSQLPHRFKYLVFNTYSVSTEIFEGRHGWGSW